MTNYFRITAYEPNHDFSIIMDTYGMFEKVWQFSADLIKRGLKILEVSSDEQFIDVNIDKLTEEEPEKPLVTVEYSLKNKKVLQCYGDHDSKPDDCVMEFVNKKWLPYANRKLKQIAA